MKIRILICLLSGILYQSSFSQKKGDYKFPNEFSKKVNLASFKYNMVFNIEHLKLKAFCQCLEDVKSADNLVEFYKNDKSLAIEPGLEGFGYYSREGGIHNPEYAPKRSINVLFLVDSLVQVTSSKMNINTELIRNNEEPLAETNDAISACYLMSTSKTLDSIIRVNMKHSYNYKASMQNDENYVRFMDSVSNIQIRLPESKFYSKKIDKLLGD